MSQEITKLAYQLGSISAYENAGITKEAFFGAFKGLKGVKDLASRAGTYLKGVPGQTTQGLRGIRSGFGDIRTGLGNLWRGTGASGPGMSSVAAMGKGQATRGAQQLWQGVKDVAPAAGLGLAGAGTLYGASKMLSPSKPSMYQNLNNRTY